MLLPLARMNSSAFSFLSDFVLVLLLFIQVPSSSSNDDLFTACSKKFECGHISAGFPFWGNDRSPACGVPELELRCENNIAKMNISQVAYRVLEINQDDGILRIAREDYMVGLCSPQFMNSTFNPKVFEFVEGYKNLTFIYGCKDAPPTIPGRIPFICKIKEVNDQGGYIQEGDTGPGECNRSVLVPVSKTDLPPIGIFPGWEELLRKGFDGRSLETVHSKLGLAQAGAVGGAFVGCWIMAFIQRRRRKAAVEKTEELPVATPPSKSLATSTNRSSNF
ncbi:hypothetical protein NC652_038863 [Populus alba x Populus x berolinensis]|nr:hypothetical protein NC652_038863 [Populus alba x Populus x berolinensis]